jgi:gas vesicle protein
MARKNGTGNGSLIAGIILGALGGALAGLFAAPKSGPALRRELQQRFSETTAPLREKADPIVSQGKERATRFVDMAADQAQDLSGKIAAMDLPFDDERVDHEPGAASMNGNTSLERSNAHDKT